MAAAETRTRPGPKTTRDDCRHELEALQQEVRADGWTDERRALVNRWLDYQTGLAQVEQMDAEFDKLRDQL